MTTKRTDAHRPSAIDPGNYVLTEGPEAFDYGWSKWSVCAHCGHAIKWIVRFDYLPTGERVDIGHICAKLLSENHTRIDYEMTRLRKRVAAERDRIAREQDRTDRRNLWLAEWPKVAEFMDEIDPATEKFDFMRDMIDALDKWGSLTERQTLAVERVMKARDEFARKQLAEVQPTTPAPEGRVQVEGEVVSKKLKETDFGMTWKMVVKLDDGNKVYGTIPSKLIVEKGDRVSFSANFKHSNDDEHFAFYSRPTQARKVEA